PQPTAHLNAFGPPQQQFSPVGIVPNGQAMNGPPMMAQGNPMMPQVAQAMATESAPYGYAQSGMMQPGPMMQPGQLMQSTPMIPMMQRPRRPVEQSSYQGPMPPNPFQGQMQPSMATVMEFNPAMDRRMLPQQMAQQQLPQGGMPPANAMELAHFLQTLKES